MANKDFCALPKDVMGLEVLEPNRELEGVRNAYITLNGSIREHKAKRPRRWQTHTHSSCLATMAQLQKAEMQQMGPSYWSALGLRNVCIGLNLNPCHETMEAGFL
jgi:hypothetical protein